MSHSPQSTQTRRGVDDYSSGWRAVLDLARRGKSWSGRERNCAFLNRGGDSFSNVSASSGLDFADDGRALAMTDWDHDGDVDVWLRNRTGPRLRLMLNQTRGEGAEETSRKQPGFVTLRLVGVECNRDAIGARVELYLKDKKLIQTVRAGDAYLSQSSKWLHFGLGNSEKISSLQVRWPHGLTESFTGVLPGGHYLLQQGSGKATQWKRPHADRPLALSPSAQPSAKAADGTQVLLPARLPLPLLNYTTYEGAKTQVAPQNRPLLISLWASWCAPCIAELKTLTKHAPELRSKGLQVLALSVDGLDQEQATSSADARRALEKLKFPFDGAMATREFIDKLDLVLQYLFDKHLPFAVPTSLLLDRQGRLAAVYRGPVKPGRLLQDLQSLNASPERLRQLALPFSGLTHRSAERRSAPHLKSLAKHFEDRYREDSLRFLTLAIQAENTSDVHTKQLTPAQEKERSRDHAETQYLLAQALHKTGQLKEAVSHYRLAAKARPDYTEAHSNLGVAVAAMGNRDEAIEHYEQALRTDPDYSPAHYNLANALEAHGKLDDAVRHYERALQIDPNDTRTHNNLALALRAQGKLTEAIERFLQALQVDPDQPLAHYNLGTCYRSQGKPDKAVHHYQRALELNPENADTLNNLGSVLMARGNVDEAIRYYQQAFQVAPHLARSHYNLARALHAQGKLEDALPYFRQTVQLAPQEPRVYSSLAAALTQQGKVEEAQTNYRIALRLASDAGDESLVESLRTKLEELSRDDSGK